MKHFTRTELPNIVTELIEYIGQHRSVSHATVVCLNGDLGAGKTTLTAELGKQLGIMTEIQSPTFVILKNYPTHIMFQNLIHIDAYRLNTELELQKLHWDEYINNSNNLIIIEWSEHVPELVPADALIVTLDHISLDVRSIDF